MPACHIDDARRRGLAFLNDPKLLDRRPSSPSLRTRQNRNLAHVCSFACKSISKLSRARLPSGRRPPPKGYATADAHVIELAHLCSQGTHPARTPGRARWCAAKRLGSDGGLGLLVRLPIPGKKISDLVGRVIWKAGEHVGEPSLGIDVVHLAGLDQGIDGGGTISASI
jgi:hypothetical protein